MRHSFWVALGLSGLFACKDDPRKDATVDLLELLETRPYELGASTDSTARSQVVVRDSSIPLYNRVFSYFADSGTSQEETVQLYSGAPGDLLASFPVTQVIDVKYDEHGDTLIAMVDHTRPREALFDPQLRDWLDDLRRNQRMGTPQEFADRMRRAFALPTRRDTLTLKIVSGPRLSYIATRSQERASENFEAMRRMAAADLQRSVPLIHPRIDRIDNFGREMGSAVSGTATIDSLPWVADSANGVYVAFLVQCRASSGDRSSMVDGFLMGPQSSRTRQFICSWMTEPQRQEIYDLKPNRFELRVIGYLGADTVLGTWLTTTH